MATAYLSLGSNLGDRLENLRLAVKRLGKHPDISIIRLSSVYLTEPVGGVEQPDFLNMALSVETALEPDDFHRVCREIETGLGGREGRIPMGPRTIDIDILLFEDIETSDVELTIPHPHMMERAFMLAPLVEIAPDVVITGNGTASDALKELKAKGGTAAVETFATLEDKDNNNEQG